MTHDHDHDLDRDAVDPALLERLMADGFAARRTGDDARVARLRHLAARLERLGAVERETLRESCVGTGDPALEREVVELTRAHLGAAPRWRRLPVAAFALAATALAAVVLWIAIAGQRPPELDPQTDFRLNGDGASSLRWRAVADDSLEFAWDPTGRRSAIWRVRVYDRDPTVGGSLLAASRELEAPLWDPRTDHAEDETLPAAWPATVWVEVLEESPSGGEREVVSEPFTR